MIAAALDTSVGAAFCLAVAGRPPISAQLSGSGRDSDRELVPWLHGLLADAGVDAAMVHEWTVGTGPGSFSGLRIGIALVKGICRGSGARFRGIPSSLAPALRLAESANLRPGGKVVIVHDARQRQLVLSVYEAHAAAGGAPTLRAVGDAFLAEPEAAAGVCRQAAACGTVQPVVAELLAGLVDLSLLPGVEAARLLGPAGWPWPPDRAAAVAGCEPVYVRPPVFVQEHTGVKGAAK